MTTERFYMSPKQAKAVARHLREVSMHRFDDTVIGLSQEELLSSSPLAGWVFISLSGPNASLGTMRRIDRDGNERTQEDVTALLAATHDPTGGLS